MKISTETVVLVVLDCALISQLFGLWIAVMVDEYISVKRRRLMLFIIGVVSLLLLQEHFNNAAYGNLFHKIVAVAGYSLRPLVIILFMKLQKPERSMRLCWWVVIFNTAVHMTTFFSGICFDYTADGGFVRGPLGYTSFVVSGILLFVLVVGGFREFAPDRKGDYLIPIFAFFLVVFATAADVVIDIEIPLSFLIVAMVCDCILYYIYLHMVFIREHEHEIEDGQRIRIMMSQIQPHFLYNTLATVRALYRKDSELADETLEKFGIYLRQNMDSLDKPNLIPFADELSHTRIYSDIEKIRFPSIDIVYDIEDDDFKIPALTVQPLVENAIRHGVRIREHGLVEVEVRKKRYGHRIIIRDNGKGFDPQAPMSGERSHIGLRNVMERIETMCGGDMKIESKLDEGTTITIRIPYAGETL